MNIERGMNAYFASLPRFFLWVGLPVYLESRVQSRENETDVGLYFPGVNKDSTHYP